MPKFCSNCGSPLSGADRFCSSCGSAQAEGAAQRVVEQPPSAQIPVRPNARLIASGVVLLLFSGWLMLSFLPEHQPMSEAEAMARGTNVVLKKDATELVQLMTWRLNPTAYAALWAVAVFTLVGPMANAVEEGDGEGPARRGR